MKFSPFTFLAAALLGFNSLSADVTFIAHRAVGDAGLDKETLSKMLNGKVQKWADGTPVKLVFLGSGELHEEMAKTFAGKSGSQFDNAWKKMLFTGQGVAPQAVSSEAEMIAAVARIPGALGYTAGSPNADVKVIPIQG